MAIVQYGEFDKIADGTLAKNASVNGWNMQGSPVIISSSLKFDGHKTANARCGDDDWEPGHSERSQPYLARAATSPNANGHSLGGRGETVYAAWTEMIPTSFPTSIARGTGPYVWQVACQFYASPYDNSPGLSIDIAADGRHFLVKNNWGAYAGNLNDAPGGTMKYDTISPAVAFTAGTPIRFAMKLLLKGTQTADATINKGALEFWYTQGDWSTLKPIVWNGRYANAAEPTVYRGHFLHPLMTGLDIVYTNYRGADTHDGYTDLYYGPIAVSDTSTAEAINQITGDVSTDPDPNPDPAVPPPIGTATVDVTNPGLQVLLLKNNEDQVKRTDAALSDTQYPHFTVGTSGTWSSVAATHWTSGFMPGILWKFYERTGLTAWRDRAITWGAAINAAPVSTHDLGFQYLNSFCENFRLTGDTAARDAANTAATLLDGRFIAAPGVLNCFSFAPYDTKINTIIDSAMDVILLLWSARNGGTNTSQKVAHAKSHLLKLAAEHVRDNGSTYHMVEWGTTTSPSATPTSKHTVQGYADTSTWSRGQAWAVNGFTQGAIALTLAGETAAAATVLAAAVKCAGYFIYPREDAVPRWDFDAPDAQRDVSAALIVADGLLQLAPLDTSADWRTAAKTILNRCYGDDYRAANSESFSIFVHGTSNKPDNVGVDAGLIYADFFGVSALQRYIGTTPTLPATTSIDMASVNEDFITEPVVLKQAPYGGVTRTGGLERFAVNAELRTDDVLLVAGGRGLTAKVSQWPQASGVTGSSVFAFQTLYADTLANRVICAYVSTVGSDPYFRISLKENNATVASVPVQQVPLPAGTVTAWKLVVLADGQSVQLQAATDTPGTVFQQVGNTVTFPTTSFTGETVQYGTGLSVDATNPAASSTEYVVDSVKGTASITATAGGTPPTPSIVPTPADFTAVGEVDYSTPDQNGGFPSVKVTLTVPATSPSSGYTPNASPYGFFMGSSAQEINTFPLVDAWSSSPSKVVTGLNRNQVYGFTVGYRNDGGVVSDLFAPVRTVVLSGTVYTPPTVTDVSKDGDTVTVTYRPDGPEEATVKYGVKIVAKSALPAGYSGYSVVQRATYWATLPYAYLDVGTPVSDGQLQAKITGRTPGVTDHIHFAGLHA